MAHYNVECSNHGMKFSESSIAIGTHTIIYIFFLTVLMVLERRFNAAIQETWLFQHGLCQDRHKTKRDQVFPPPSSH